MRATIYISILSLIAFSIISCGGKKNGKNKEAELAAAKSEQKALKDKIALLEGELGKKDSLPPATAVEVTDMIPQTFINYIDVQGVVDAENNQVASPEVPGVIQNINVHTGQYVNKGQVVATLKANILNDGMAELELQINFAKTLYDKQKRLWDQEIGTEVQLLGAKNNYESLVKKRNSLQTQKTMYNIIAPISGVVDAIDIKQGSAVSPGMPIGIRIVSNSNLKVKADIAENYGARVQGGDQVLLIFPDIKDSIFTVRQNGKLRPNMVVKARVVGYRNDRAFVLPNAVIQKLDGQNFVYIMDIDGTAKLKNITLGESYMGQVEIVSGLGINDKVITNGFADLNEGDRVQVY
jgi:membrane fusion protein, multidrug efflux system